jgi:hypothetical protein
MFGDQLFDTHAVAAFARIAGREQRFELRNQHDSIGAVGAFERDTDWHGLVPANRTENQACTS